MVLSDGISLTPCPRCVGHVQTCDGEFVTYTNASKKVAKRFSVSLFLNAKLKQTDFVIALKTAFFVIIRTSASDAGISTQNMWMSNTR